MHLCNILIIFIHYFSVFSHSYSLCDPSLPTDALMFCLFYIFFNTPLILIRITCLFWCGVFYMIMVNFLVVISL